MQQKFSSQMVLEPFDVGILGSFSNIDPDKLSLQDIILVRQEGAFEEFRKFLRRAFEKLHSQDNFSDFETEFAATFRQELKDNTEQIRAMTEKSSVLREIFSNSDRILVGAALGAMPGAIAESREIAVLGAALVGAGMPAWDVVRGLIRESPNSKTRVSLRNHFLAIQPGKSEPT